MLENWIKPQIPEEEELDERLQDVYKRQNLDTILTDDPLNDSLIEEIKSIPGVTDVMTREIVSVNPVSYTHLYA